MRYGPHKQFIAPARRRAELWRTVLGFMLTSAAQMGLIFVIYGVVSAVLGADIAESVYQGVFFSTMTSRETLLLLLTTGLLAIGLAAMIGPLHQRGFATLFGPLQSASRDFWAVLKALALLYALLYLVPSLPADEPLQSNLSLGSWLSLLPLAIPALLIQVSSEELLFRGYLQQQIAARFSHPALWIGLPSALFAWGHYSVDVAGENAILTALWAGAFGIAAADLTARSGNLGAAIALHLANNAGAILIVSLAGPASGLALYLYPMTMDSPDLAPQLVIELAVLAVSWLAARVALRL